MKKLVIILVALLMLTGCSFSSDKTNKEDKTIQIAEKYNTKEIISNAIVAFDKKGAKQAPIFEGVTSFGKNIGLSFEGIPKKDVLVKVLALLKKYNVKATFFLQGVKVAEEPSLAKLIVKDGHEIGNYTLNATKKMQNSKKEVLITDFVKTNAILKSITGVNATMIRCNATSYTEKVRKAVYASGLKYAIAPSYFLSYQSLNNASETLGFVSRLKKGKILSIKLDSVLDSTEFEKEVRNERPADDKQAGIKNEKQVGTEEDRLVNVIEMVLNAAKKSEVSLKTISKLKKNENVVLSDSFVNVRKSNGGKMATILKNIYTTKDVIGLSFRGLKSEATLNKVLQVLRANGMKATFFVTSTDILKRKSMVRKIIAAGHELGNGGSTGKTMMKMTYQEACGEIYNCQKLLKSKFGKDVKYFMTIDAITNPIIREAASSFGYQIAGYNKSPIVRSNVSLARVQYYFRNGFLPGDVVALRLDNYSRIADVTRIVANKAGSYQRQVLNLSAFYRRRETLRSLKSIPGWNAVHLNTNWSSKEFSSSRIVEKINTTKKVAFLTFDDWGSDRTIMNLLAVLKRNHVKGTFFVRGNGPDVNPALLKKISDAGHEIGNHTYSHIISTQVSKSRLQREVVKCHQVITQAIGKQPTLFFRPPTMETSESAEKAVLATGIKYVIRGVELSTHDYVRSSSQVVRFVMKGIQPGGIITMHMSDNASAAKAVPVLVKKLREKGYTIGVLGDYLK